MNQFVIFSEEAQVYTRIGQMSRKRRRHVIRQKKKKLFMTFDILAESPEFKHPTISNQMPGITIEE